jgi:predicted ester cyclase
VSQDGLLPQADFATEDLTLLVLEEGPDRASFDGNELQRLLNAHLGWMITMAGTGELLTAGALLDPAPSGRLTGLGFSRLAAEAVGHRAELDPAVQAGVERVRLVTYRLPKGWISFPRENDLNKNLSRRLYEEVFGRGNLEAADEIMAEDVISHGPGSPPIKGRDQIKWQATLLRTAIPDLKATLHDQVAEGDRVLSRWTGSGTHTGEATFPTGTVAPTGNPVSFDELRVDRYANGRIAESWFIPDRMTLWSQLGLLR